MTNKKLGFLFTSTLMLSHLSMALETEKLNPFLAKADKRFNEYLTYEMKVDMQKAMEEYNANRKKVEINDETLKKIKLNKDKVKELPPIRYENPIYIIEYKKTKIEFNAAMIFKGTFKLNGNILHFDEAKLAMSSEDMDTKFSRMLMYLIESANAGEQFVADPESTKILIAALLVYGNGYEKLGLFHACMLDCKMKVANANRDRVKQRIQSQIDSCESSVEKQNDSINTYRRYDDVAYLNQISDSDFKSTYELLKSMSKIESKKEAAGINDSAFDDDLSNRGDCYRIVRGTFTGWSTLYRTSIEIDQVGNEAKAICESIERMKSCLSSFHENAKYIENSSRGYYKKNFKYDPPAVPVIRTIDK